MTRTIRSRTIPAQLAVSKRFTTSLAEIAADMSAAYAALYELIEHQEGLIEGPPFSLYNCEAFDPNHIDAEACIPVKREIDTPPGIGIRALPSYKMAISTTHTGPYEQLAEAYERLVDYAKANYLQLMAPTYEIYLKSCPDYPPEEFVTEIVWPVNL